MRLLNSEGSPEEAHVALLPRPPRTYDAPLVFMPGTMVSLINLRANRDLNGLTGRVSKYVPDGGRYAVATVRGLKSVPGSNLVEVSPLPTSDPNLERFIGHPVAGPNLRLPRCFCIFCAVPLSLEVAANLLLRDGHATSAMLAHYCGANVTIMKAPLGPPGDSDVEKGVLIVLQVFGGAPFFSPTGGLSESQATDLLLSNVSVVNHLDCPMGHRDALKRLPPIEGAKAVRLALRAATALEPAGPPFTVAGRQAGNARLEEALRAAFDWPWPMPRLPVGAASASASPVTPPEPDPVHGPDTDFSDGSLPIKIFCLWCGHRLTTTGSSPTAGKWCGIMSCPNHRSPLTSSGVAILSHGMLTMNYSVLFTDL